MKKTVLVLMLGLLLMSGNVYADGNLNVSGQLGVGTETPAAKVDIQATNETALKITVNKDAKAGYFDGSWIRLNINSADVRARALLVQATHRDTTQATSGGINGANLKTQFYGSGTIDQSVIAMRNQIEFNTYAGNYNISNAVGNMVDLGAGWDNLGDHIITNYTAFLSSGVAAPKKAGRHSFSGTDWRHAHFKNWGFGVDQLGTLINATGLWIDKQTIATNNRGIVLDGDGEGSDIVFGPNQEASIYSSNGRLWVKDDGGNETIISPHDPETGEWIYYSENVKTGETVRVNMEELVRTVEELSGKKFMVKTLKEIE